MLKSSLAMLALGLLVGCTQSPTSEVEAAPKQIALTYDDAPLGDGPRYSGEARTDALIAQLAEAESGPVAIFVTTKGFELDQGVARIHAYAEAGHYIANHSDQHMWGSRTATDAYIADIAQAETKLEQFDNRRPWFRFPFLDEGGQGEANKTGEKRDAYRAALAEQGLISGYVTVDTYDWHLDRLWSQAVKDGRAVDMEALSSVYVDMVVDAANHYDALGQRVLDRQPVQVLLLHENDLAASFTTDMIEALRVDGWEIVDPDLAFADPIANQNPHTLFSGMGRISALAADQGLRDWATLNHWSVSELEIDKRVYKSGAFERPVEDQ
ncbi:MAG: polysaccharide deacetylase family protein [Pseudomonadota bacterium]